MAGYQPAVRAALALESTTGEKGFGAAPQARGAQVGDGVGHAEIVKVACNRLRRSKSVFIEEHRLRFRNLTRLVILDLERDDSARGTDRRTVSTGQRKWEV